MTTNPIIIVQGGQYGSEAKGAIAAYICRKEKVDYAVRTGATNAGHTVYHGGRAYKMQQLPVGWVNPDTSLVIGAGALIDPHILYREIRMVADAGFTGQIYVDPRAGLHESVHQQRSKASDRHHAIGATGKGCSEALIDRIRLRGKGGRLFRDVVGAAPPFHWYDTEALLNQQLDLGSRVLLEGTQGQGLDLYLGPYPYTTHKQTGPAQWLLEAGLSPALPTDIVMVVRTYPIRVAGNSGPLPRETSWVTLAADINLRRAEADLPPLVHPTAISRFMNMLDAAAANFEIPPGFSPHAQHLWPDRERYTYTLSELNTAAWKLLNDDTQAELLKLFEMTTVTKKLRRIAHLDLADLRRFSRQIRPHRVALTFMNYVFPERFNQRWAASRALTALMRKYIAEVAEACRAPVTMVSWGPTSDAIQEVIPVAAPVQSGSPTIIQ